jgi:hypothetical protein
MRAWPLIAPFLLASCVATESTKPAWWQQTAADLGQKLGGCAVGDFDSQLPGNEIAVVAGDGGVYLVWREGDDWSSRQIHTTGGESIQCVAGNLLAYRSGDELITLGVSRGGEDDGGPGLATVIGLKVDRAPLIKTLVEPEALIHAGAMGDFDPTQPGDELAYGGFFGEARLAYGTGRSITLGPLPGNAKGAAAGVGGVVFACDDGSVVRFRRDGDGGWQQDLLASTGAVLARVAATDDEVVFAANDGVLRAWRDGQTRVLAESSDRLRGAVIADLDPLREGDEYATAGYDGQVLVIAEDVVDGQRGMTVTTAGRDGDRFHHLAVGELPGLGTCLVACGYSGRVIVIGHSQ